MHYYGSSGIGHEITAIQYLTDNRGQAFREQVLEYMEDQYGIGLIPRFYGTYRKVGGGKHSGPEDGGSGRNYPPWI